MAFARNVAARGRDAGTRPPRRARRWLPLMAAACWFGSLAASAAPAPPPEQPSYFAGNPATRRLAFRYRTGLRVLGPAEGRSGVWGIYQQTSSWYLDNEDRGYTVESIFSPEAGLFLEGDRLGDLAGWWPGRLHLAVSYSHHSNGVDGELSRSWNHVNLGLHLGDVRRDAWSGSLVGWIPFNVEAGNPDLAGHAGHGRLAAVWAPRRPWPWLGRAVVDAAAFWSPDSPRGGIVTRWEASLSFVPAWLGRPPFADGGAVFGFFVQWVSGRGESLIEYDREREAVRFGLRLW